MHIDRALISAFIKRSKRDRYREILADPRLHHKFTRQLAHFRDFDPKYRVEIPVGKSSVEYIAKELKKRHSPDIVLAISENSKVDQQDLPLQEALRETVGLGMGTVLSCIPGRLAYVETEDERYILERQNVLEKREYIRFVVGRKDEDSKVEQGFFKRRRRRLNGDWLRAPTQRSCTRCGLGLVRIWKGQLPLGAINSASGFVGSKLKQMSTSPAFGRWRRFLSGTASTLRR